MSETERNRRDVLGFGVEQQGFVSTEMLPFSLVLIKP